MAITTPTQTSDFAGFLKPEQAEAYFDQARKVSAAQRLGRQIPLGINGQEIPVVTSKATAGWVAEGGQKPTTKGGLGLKTIKPHKLAAIAVVSAEVVRANPGNYINLLRDDVAEAFAVAFDAAVFHGTNSPFGAGQNLAAATKAVELGTAATTAGGVYADINAGLALLANDGKKLTGFAFDTVTEPVFNAAVDANGRPLFVEPTYEDGALRAGRLLGRPAYLGDGVNGGSVVGFGGDWSQFVWGVVGGITYDVSTQATVTIDGELVSLWEHNLVAIRAEAEFGALINDTSAFVKYTNAVA